MGLTTVNQKNEFQGILHLHSILEFILKILIKKYFENYSNNSM